MTAPASHEGPPDPGALARRVFSLSGVVPLGAFLVLHVVINARALRGQDAFASAIASAHGIPAIGVLTLLFVYVPLAVHAAIGIWLVATRTALAQPSPYSPTMTNLMRASGVVALAFVAMHLPEMHVLSPGPRLQGGELLTILSADLSSTSHGVPWRGLAYLVGTAATTLHFVGGLWGFLARTPRGGDPATRRWFAWAVGVFGMALWLLYADVVVLHATGSRIVGRVAPPAVSGEPCPPPGASAR